MSACSGHAGVAGWHYAYTQQPLTGATGTPAPVNNTAPSSLTTPIPTGTGPTGAMTLSDRVAKNQAHKYLNKHYASYARGTARSVRVVPSKMSAHKKRVRATWRYHGHRCSKTLLVTKVRTSKYAVKAY